MSVSSDSYGVDLQECPGDDEQDASYQFDVSNVMNISNVEESE